MGPILARIDKAKLAALDVELTKITTKFGENVLDATNQFELIITEEAKLAGLPATAIAAARQSAQAKGREGWRFTLQGPSYLALMTYLDDREIREQVYREFGTRATREPLDNRPILSRILELRNEKAHLLGFPDFADFVLSDRMAKEGRQALSFLREIERKTRSFFERENEDLRQFRRRRSGSLGYRLLCRETKAGAIRLR